MPLLAMKRDTMLIYDADIRRGRTWRICVAMTLNGWLPCTGVKEGYFSSDNFFEWLQLHFLPAVNGLNRPMVSHG